MSLKSPIVLMNVDPDTTAMFQSAALHERGSRVLIARTWLHALALVQAEHPDLVVAAPDLERGAEPLCRGIAESTGDHAPMIALLVEADDSADAVWPSIGSPLALALPVSPIEARALIRAAADARTRRDRLRQAQEALHALEARVAQADDDKIALLLHALDIRYPGATVRAERRRQMAADLCERLSIPAGLRRDLDLAVQLQELGRMLCTPGDAWRAAQCTRTVLATIPGFEGAAQMMDGACENWDGTGAPARLLQGQIPLRSRILRVLGDYLMTLDAPGSSETAALERIAARSGTWYDPMVVVHLRALVAEQSVDASSTPHTIMPVEELGVGMVLAEDLYTDSGIKLLSRGTAITPPTLETILRRHRVEPLLHGAVVERRSA